MWFLLLTETYRLFAGGPDRKYEAQSRAEPGLEQLPGTQSQRCTGAPHLLASTSENRMGGPS